MQPLCERSPVLDQAAVAGHCRRLLRLIAGRPGRLVWQLCFALAAIATAVPLFVDRYLPIQDLPQHVAAVRVLSDYTNPAFRFEHYFELQLLKTQYLSVYGLAALLAVVLGPLLATKVVLAASMVALPYSIRSLLTARGKPESYALLCLPLAYNAHFLLGFINFIAGLPLLFWGMATAVRLSRQWTAGRASALAALLLLLLYTHVVPFLLLAGITGLLALRWDWRTTGRRLVPLAPALVGLGLWASTNPAGRAVVSLTDPQQPRRPRFATVAESLRDIPNWLTDILPASGDEQRFVGWLLLLTTLLAMGGSTRPSSSERDSRLVAVLVPLVALAYFVTPVSYDWIWPINARFPLLFLLLLLAVLPTVARSARVLVAVAALALHLSGVVAVSEAFAHSAREEYRGLNELLAEAKPGKKLAALVWARGSRHVKFSPFLHSAAWYQAERGGAVVFSFADFPQSPFRFREADRPPRVPPRWEWQPQRVRPERDLDWFDYVLTRGGARRLPGFELLRREGTWALWQRSGPHGQH